MEDIRVKIKKKNCESIFLKTETKHCFLKVVKIAVIGDGNENNTHVDIYIHIHIYTYMQVHHYEEEGKKKEARKALEPFLTPLPPLL